MNGFRRVSAIYRDIAALFGELVATAENEERTLDALDARGAKRNAARKARIPDRPQGESDEVAQAQARRILRREGFVVKQ